MAQTERTDGRLAEHAQTNIGIVANGLAKATRPHLTEIDAWYLPNGDLVSVWRTHRGALVTIRDERSDDETSAAFDDDEAARLALALLRAIPLPSNAIQRVRAQLAKAVE